MRFLIVKTSALGDIIHSFPTLSYLRKKFPQAVIDWVVEEPFSELVQSHPEVSNTLCIKTKQWRSMLFDKQVQKDLLRFRKQLRQIEYDAVFDLQGNVKSAFVTFQARSQNKIGFSLKTISEWPNVFATNCRFNHPPELNIRNDNLSIVQQYFKDSVPFTETGVILNLSSKQTEELEDLLKQPSLENKPLVIVCPGAFWKNKQLPFNTLLPFLQKIREHLQGVLILVWGNQEEHTFVTNLQKELSTHSYIIPRLPLPVLQNLMARSKLVIAMDSLPLHLAGTTSTPTFSVFGPSLAKKYKPDGKKHFAIQGKCPFNKTFEKRCPILRTCSSGACINDLNASSLFEEFFTWWQAYS